MSRRRDKASPSMAAAAMSLVQLERWLQDRVERRPVATSLPVLDGYIAAIVAGPVSIVRSTGSVRCSQSTPTPSTTAARRSSPRSPPPRSTTTLSAKPSPPTRIGSNRSISASRTATSMRVPGVWDSTPPCDLEYRLGRLCSTPATSMLLPILIHCEDDQGRPLLGPTNKARQTEQFLRNAHGDIPAAVEAMRQYWMPIRYARAG